MALRYVGLQIAQAREECAETDYSATNGVPQATPLGAARDAVIHVQNQLYLAAPRIFDVIGYLTPVQNQIEYTLPENAYIEAAIAAIEYSPNGDSSQYSKLTMTDYGYRNGGVGTPTLFTPYGDGKVIIDPAPNVSGGLFRVVYGALKDAPDLRRGKIEAVELNGGATAFVTVTLAADDSLDVTTLQQNEWICVNDVSGNVTYYNIHYSGYDTATRKLTFDLTPAVGSGAIAVGSYVTVGKYTTTHIKLNPIADPVVMAFIRRRLYLQKSSEDKTAEEDNIAAFTKEMVAVYKRQIRTLKKPGYTGRFEGIGR